MVLLSFQSLQEAVKTFYSVSSRYLTRFCRPAKIQTPRRHHSRRCELVETKVMRVVKNGGDPRLLNAIALCTSGVKAEVTLRL